MPLINSEFDKFKIFFTWYSSVLKVNARTAAFRRPLLPWRIVIVSTIIPILLSFKLANFQVLIPLAFLFDL